MNVGNRIKVYAVAVASLAVCCVSGNAAITLDLDNATTFAKTGINAQLDSNTSFITGTALIGIYGFSHSGTPTLPNNGPVAQGQLFWSVCLDPMGQVDWNAHSYDRLTFAQANPGINPNQWASSGSDYWGIQNANYIWRNNYNSVLFNGGSATVKREMGTALALAMYEALYDSTGYGDSLGGNHFSVTSGMNASMLGYYNAFLASLSGFNTGTDIYSGYILRGNPVINGQSGQEFVLIGTPVPEASTVIGGALLLLPLAVSVWRRARKGTVAKVG